MPKNKKTEESIQKQVCSYLRLQYPHVIFRSDYASGMHLSIYQARNHASMQSCKGWPDLFIYHPSASGKYAGLALELKKPGTTVYLKNGPRKGRLTGDLHIQEQAATLQALRNAGYYSDFAVGFDEAVKIIDSYMGKPETAELF